MAGKGSLVSDFSTSHSSIKDHKEENDVRFTNSHVKTDVPKKKTTFKITSVTKSSQRGGSGDLLSQENDLDSLDDLDETVDSHTEDLSSEIFDTNSRATDVDSQDPLLTPDEVVKENEMKEKPARFKVVKVETNEPFKRGRWTCCDYLDGHDKVDNKMDEINTKSGVSSGTNSVLKGVDDSSKNPSQTGAAGTSMYHQPSAAQDIPLTAYSQGEVLKPIQPAVSSHTSHNPANQTSSFSNQAASLSSPYAAQLGMLDQPVRSLPVSNRPGSVVPVLPPMQQGETQTSQSLSGNIPFPTPDNRSLQQPVPQGSMVPATVATSATSSYQPPVQIQEYGNAASQGQASSSQGQQVPAYQQPVLYEYQDMQQQTGYALTNGTINNSHSIGSNVTNALPQAGMPYDGYRPDSPKLSVSGTALNNLTSLRSEGMQEARPALGAGLAQIAVGGVSTAGPGTGDDEITEEASTSAVAIDNKIEQAMDLVKSHLMYAVREEVEVLKEVIKELMERMHKVEQENKLLRSEATPETLSRLPPPLPPLQKPVLQQFMVSLHNPSSSSSS